MSDLVFASLVILVSSFVQGTTGFGFAMVAAPLLLLFIDAKSVVVLVVMLGAVNGAIRLVHSWRFVDMKLVVPVSISRTLGVPVGVYLLASLNPNAIKLAIAILIIPAAMVLLLNYSYRSKRQFADASVAGFLSGALGASTSVGGPPLIVFLLGQNLGKELFVGTISACFLVGGIISVGAYWLAGMVTPAVLLQAAVSLPVLALGFYTGDRVLKRISNTLFKRIAALAVMGLAIGIIVTVIVQSR